jgi:hypothetical protein
MAQMSETYLDVMAGRSTAQLLALLRERHAYLPSAVAAAVQELHSREVSGFEVSNALDDGDAETLTLSQIAELPLPKGWIAFWLLLPFLAMTPIGTRHFHRWAASGYRRRSVQYLEVVTIGFTAYMIVVMLALL